MSTWFWAEKKGRGGDSETTEDGKGRQMKRGRGETGRGRKRKRDDGGRMTDDGGNGERVSLAEPAEIAESLI